MQIFVIYYTYKFLMDYPLQRSENFIHILINLRTFICLHRYISFVSMYINFHKYIYNVNNLENKYLSDRFISANNILCSYLLYVGSIQCLAQLSWWFLFIFILYRILSFSTNIPQPLKCMNE